MARLPEPPRQGTDEKLLLLEYLDYYRSVVESKVSGISEKKARTSVLPSGWTIAELLKHLVFMERRWLQWGFAGEQVDAPWGDNEGDRPDAPWEVLPEEDVQSLICALMETGARTRAIVEDADLLDRAALGGRFATEAEAPQLVWILLHVLQEYARHAGHLDIQRELVDGRTGE